MARPRGGKFRIVRSHRRRIDHDGRVLQVFRRVPDMDVDAETVTGTMPEGGTLFLLGTDRLGRDLFRAL